MVPIPGVVSERGSPAARRAGMLLGPALFLVVLWLPGLPLDLAQRRMGAVTLLTATWWLTIRIATCSSPARIAMTRIR